MNDGVRCMWMRGGTSKGGVFLAEDLPAHRDARDALLLRIMGSPDPRQIDGMGGADPLTSKVAVVGRSQDPDADIDYLFLQVSVDEARVSEDQNCGNMLAAVAACAIERGLVPPHQGTTPVEVHMVNSGQRATVMVRTRNGRVEYSGDVAIDGVPGTAAPVLLRFHDTAGSSCGALLPTGNLTDDIDGITCTLIDNGMPCILVAATDMSISGYEARADLDADQGLKERLERLRLAAAPRMRLGDVTNRTVPKLMMLAPPRGHGTISVRSFIPHRCHASVGVLGAVTVATACLMPGSVAASLIGPPVVSSMRVIIEHPTGAINCIVEEGGSASVERTARKLFDGRVF